jgi:hypothetical protein
MKREKVGSHQKPSHPHLVVITDGEDNESTEQNKDTIKGILHRPGDYAKSHNKDGKTFANFHCSLISVGSKDSEQSMNFMEITKGKTNLHHWAGSYRSPDDFASANGYGRWPCYC